jgi:hypothetical protein
MHPRLEQEWPDILAAYPGARHLEEPERILVDIELVDGLYRSPRTEIAVVVPVGYASTGPDSFYVPAGLAMTDGRSLPVSDASGVGLPGWWQVSFHFVDERGVSTWHPTADPQRGDNLTGYLNAIESFLARECA